MDEPKRCFDVCCCSCGQVDNQFDEIAARELRVPLKLHDLCRQNICWYTDRTIDDFSVWDWPLKGRSGLYFLWHKDDYCSVHERFHMTALYVGKGSLSQRIRKHWASKDTSEQLLIYFTFVEMENRIAKYAEQLLLDLYDLPLNRAENTGRARLCAHFTQCEVD